MSFAHPFILAGIGLAALPVVIHLLLRPRPRRVIFPALTLMQAAFAAGHRASRLRNVALLIARAAAVVALAILLAGPTCSESRGAAGSDVRLNIVLVDDSLSLSYRDPAGPRREWLRGAALSEMRAADESAGEPWILFRSSLGDAQPPEPLQLPGLAGRWEAYTPGDNVRPLGSALRLADRAAAGSPARTLRLWIVTDLAAHAWRDVTPVSATSAERLEVVIVAPEGDSANLGLVAAGAAVSSRALRAGTACDCPVIVRAQGAPAAARVLATRDGKPWGGSDEIQLAADQSATVLVRGGAAEAGVAGVEFLLQPADRFDPDQRCFAVLTFADRPVVWLARPARADASDFGCEIIQNLVAPPALAASDHLAELVVSEDFPAASDARPALVVVPSDAASPALARVALAHAQRGAQLLLIPSASSAGRVDWPGLRELLLDDAPRVVQRDARADWIAGASLTGVPEADAELSLCRLARTLEPRLLAGDATIHARLSDGTPFLLSRALGAGRIWLLGTSPDPAWSELGQRAAALLSLLDALIQRGGGLSSSSAQFAVGDEPRGALPGLADSGLLRVASTSPPRPAVWRRLKDGVPDQPWPSDAPGLYEVRTSAGERRAVYAVNWPAAEADLRAITLPEVAEKLGAPRVLRASAVAHSSRGEGLGRVVGRLRPDLLASIGLVALLCLEVLLAGREPRSA